MPLVVLVVDKEEEEERRLLASIRLHLDHGSRSFATGGGECSFYIYLHILSV